MRAWGRDSLRVYNQLDPRLQEWCDWVLQEVADVSLISGHRDRIEQTTLFENGFSKLQFPQSKHNKDPSLAVDLQPYPRPRDNEKLCAALGWIAGRGWGIAQDMGIVLRWGGDWDSDGDLTDQDFDDLFHFELRDGKL